MLDSRHTDPLLGLSQRLPPSNMMAEQALLGALLANNGAYDRVSGFLAPEHFIDTIHGKVYAAIARRVEAGQLADAVTLQGDFANTGALDEAGGPAYLAKLLSAMVGIINVGEYGQAIFAAWKRREIISIGENAVNGAFSGDNSPDEICNEIGAAVDRVQSNSTSRSAISFADATAKALSRSEAAFSNGGMLGYRTGFASLDRMLAGLEPTSVYYIAGRPAMGKSSAALQWATGLAKEENLPVLFVSQEMSAEQLLMRQISMETGIPFEALRTGLWKSQDAPVQWTRAIGDAQIKLGKLPIVISDQSDQLITQIASNARTTKRKHGKLGAVFVDYLQITRAPVGMERSGLTEQTAVMSKQFKWLAKSLECPVVVLSQLNRSTESRDDKRPQLSDLKQSGAIEQDADVVVGLYRHEYYLENARPLRGDGDSDSDYQSKVDDWQKAMDACAGQAEWLVLKQRSGRTGSIRMLWDGAHTSFKEPQN